jgi:drug/metabolite transporter (DMT)-like permease
VLTGLFVLTRIVANPASNVFQKQLAARGAHPVWIIAATHALLTLVAGPLLLAAGLRWFSTAFWIDMAVCAVLAVTSNVLLVYALRLGDLSVLGPINAYKPIVSMVLAFFLLGETPTRLGLAGIALIVGASYFVVDRQNGAARGVGLRLAALVFSATEAVFLKRAILRASPETAFLVWAVLGLPVALFAAAVIRANRPDFRADWRSYLSLALTTGLMQSATLFTFGKLEVGYSLALFQLSTLLTVWFGHRYFQERDLGRRLAASVVMVAGAALIVTSPAPDRAPRAPAPRHTAAAARPMPPGEPREFVASRTTSSPART